MKKNGFTLVEMMTVVVILVLLGLLAVFSISSIVKHSSDKIYELQVANVIDAARTYAIAKSSELSETNQITLCDLKRAGLIDVDFINPKTEEQFDESLIIDINKNSFGKYDVTFDAISKIDNYYCALTGRIEDQFRVTLLGNSPYYASLGDSYNDPGYEYEYIGVGTFTETGKEEKWSVENLIENGTFTKTGTFFQTYIVTGKIDGTPLNISATRTIIVKSKDAIEDNIAPVISLKARDKDGACTSNDYDKYKYIIAGENFSYPCCSSTDGACQMTDDFKNTSTPGTYEISYKSSDSAGNTTTEVVTVVVREKNKPLIGKVIVDTFDWTNEGINLVVEPLYNGTSCSDFLYSFDAGNSWQTSNTYTVTTNGTHKIGIKSNTNVCSEVAEDVFTYKVTNVDLESPLLTNASVLVKDSDGKTKTAESKYETINGELIEHKYYYTNSSVTISEPSGATDSLSGIGTNSYTIFVNDVAQDVTDVSLNDEGRYVVELQAIDRAGNESDKKEVAIIIIDKTAPVCKFNTCTTISSCRNNPVITGTNVTYDAANGRYKVVMNSTTELVKFALTCTDTYYEQESAYSENKEITLEKIMVRNENTTVGASTIVSSQFTSAESNCESGVCTKNYSYIINVNVGTASTYNSDPIYLRISDGVFQDKAGNSSLKNDSMFLAKSN